MSCAVKAQDLQNQDSTLINKTEDTSKSELIKKNNDVKKITKKPVKYSKKKSKKSKKKHKIVKKRIIKKVSLEKKKIEKKAEEAPLSDVKEQIKIDESLEKYKNGELNNFQEIDGEYLIESELKNNCDRITAEKCFRADKFFQEPYFHYTMLTIFNQKVVAEQYFEGENRVKDKVFLKVQDGEYLIYTKNNNKIFLVVKNGIANELVVLNGDLSKETKIVNKCQYADKLLAFHRLYKTNHHEEKTIYYSDKKNFKGLVETTIYSEKYQPKNLYAIFKTPTREIHPIQNLNLCKNGNNFEVIERDFTKNECDKKFRCAMKTLASYGSEGFEINNKTFLFDDFDKNKNLITLNLEQSNGLLQEIHKLGAEDKNLLKSQCFNDKNIDIINCSIYEKCNDSLIVEACEVNFIDNLF